MTLTKVQKTRIELTKIAAEILGTGGLFPSAPSADDVARLAFYLEEGQAAFVLEEGEVHESEPILVRGRDLRAGDVVRNQGRLLEPVEEPFGEHSIISWQILDFEGITTFAIFVKSQFVSLIERGPEPQQRTIVGYVRAKDLWGDDETMTLRILELVGPDAQTFQFKVQPLDEREHDGERHYWSWAPDAWVGLTKISDAAPPDRPMVNAPLE